MDKKYLSCEEILNGIKELSKSQGYYGRLYNSIMEDEENFEEFKNWCEENKFKDIVDFILCIEG